MAANVSRRLVIDASIARAAGETKHPTSKNCRDFLEAVRKHRHKLVLSPNINTEWDKHQSRFAFTWRRKMIATKSVVFLQTDAIIQTELRDKIDTLIPDDGARREMLKDVHLLEAALATDHTVTSLNELDRKRFQSVCDSIDEIRRIVWVNPDKAEEGCLAWVESGAPPDDHRKLGYKGDED